MYSYEDRIRAVKLYIKLGKRTGATIRQLGYPTKNALKSWHREYEQGYDFPVGYVLSRPKYSCVSGVAGDHHVRKLPTSAPSAGANVWLHVYHNKIAHIAYR